MIQSVNLLDRHAYLGLDPSLDNGIVKIFDKDPMTLATFLKKHSISDTSDGSSNKDTLSKVVNHKKTKVLYTKTNSIEEFVNNSNAIENIFDLGASINHVKAWRYLQSKNKLTTSVILKTHKILMEDLDPTIAGKLRTVSVRVGYRICPAFKDIPVLLKNWLKKYADGIDTEDQAKTAHVEFEKIHPFRDGNGRTGRLLWLWHRSKAKLPFKIIYHAEVNQYYNWFKESNEQHRYEMFLQMLESSNN